MTLTFILGILAAALAGGEQAFGQQMSLGTVSTKAALITALTVGFTTAVQHLFPSKYNREAEAQAVRGGDTQPLALGLTKKKSFGWGGLLNAGLAIGATVATGGAGAILPALLPAVVGAISGGTATVTTPPAITRPRI